MGTLPANGRCPKCGMAIRQTEIEVHSVQSDTAEYWYECEHCGRVKVKEVSMRRSVQTRQEKGNSSNG